MKDQGIPRRERDRLRHQREILDVAMVLFSENGFHNVSMQQIAKKAEFAIGTLYNFFDNKDDIYITIIRELTDKFHGALTRAIETGDCEVEKLRKYITVKNTVFRENLAVVRLYHRETIGTNFSIKAGLDDGIRVQYAQFMNCLAGVFEDGIRKKRFNKIAEPIYLAVAIDSLTNAILLGCLEDPENRSYPEDPDVLLNIFFKGLLDS